MRPIHYFLGGIILMAGVALVSQFEDEPVANSYSPRVKEKIEQSNGKAEFDRMFRSNVNTGEVDEQHLMDVKRQLMKSGAKRGALGMSFSFVGPNNVGGRTQAILVDNADNQKIYAGSVTGGMFISENGGNEWTSVWDVEDSEISHSHYIRSIAQTGNGDVYVATAGAGIFISKDRGANWSQLSATEPSANSEFNTVYSLDSDPNDATTMFAGTNSGVFYSEDRGESWTRVVYQPSNCSVAVLGSYRQVKFSGDGSRLFAVRSGALWYSDNPKDPCSYVQGSSPLPTSGSVKNLVATSPENPDIVHFASVSGSGDAVLNLYKSVDGGDTWTYMSPGLPTSDPTYSLCASGTFPICWYAFAFAASPTDAEKLFIGGLQLWRFDGNWTLAAAGGEPPYYVHVDHQYFTWDPNNPEIMYLGNDGGVFKSVNDGEEFFEMNLGFRTTEFYDIDANANGVVIGGTQDNGLMNIDPSAFGTPNYGVRTFNQGVTNGDGMAVVVADIVDAKFTSSQSAALGRSRVLDQQGAGIVSDTVDGTGLFVTTVGYWESDNDVYSRDSIDFTVDTTAQVFAVANGSQKTFTGTITPLQSAANPVYTSLSVTAGVQTVHDFDGDGVMEGDGTGTVDQDNGIVQITFDVAPQTNTQIKLNYTNTYSAGSTLELLSKTENLPVKHVLKSDLAPGDVLKVQDPVQSLLVVSSGSTPDGSGMSGVLITRDGPRFNADVKWMSLNLGGQPNCYEFSPDGRNMYIAVGSQVLRVNGMNNLYYPMNPTEVSNAVTVQSVYSGTGNIRRINIHPEDPEQMLVAHGQTGINNHVVLLTGISSGFATSRNISGDLPDMPFYDAQFDVTNPNRVVAGSEFGVFSTDDIDVVSPEWGREDNFPWCQVFDIEQQRLGSTEASNHEVMYFGTHGRGIYKSESLVGVDDELIDHNKVNAKLLKVFPNPVSDRASIEIAVDQRIGDVTMIVYDVRGNVVYGQENIKLEAGANEVDFSASSLQTGSYFFTIGKGDFKKAGKFVVLK